MFQTGKLSYKMKCAGAATASEKPKGVTKCLLLKVFFFFFVQYSNSLKKIPFLSRVGKNGTPMYRRVRLWCGCFIRIFFFFFSKLVLEMGTLSLPLSFDIYFKRNPDYSQIKKYIFLSHYAGWKESE